MRTFPRAMVGHTEPRRDAVRSPTAAARAEHAIAWLCAQGPAREVAIVCGTHDGAAEVARAATVRVGASFGWGRFTLGRLAYTLAEPALVAAESVIANGVAIEALCARVLTLHRAALTRLAAVSSRPGMPRALARTLDELRMAGVMPSEVQDPDLAVLFAAFETERLAARLADRAAVFETALAAVPHTRSRPFAMLDVPIHHALERDLVRALWSYAQGARIIVPSGDELTLRHLADGGISIEDLASSTADTPLGPFHEALFRPDRHAASSEGLTVFSAPGEGRESVEIARRILTEAARGVPFDRIAVLLRSPEAYRATLQSAFRRARIPMHLAQGSAHPDPSGRAFAALLACAQEGLSASRFAEYLSLGDAPDPTAHGRPPDADEHAWAPADDDTPAIDGHAPPDEPSSRAPGIPRRWEQLIVDAAVFGTLARWRRRLAGLRVALTREHEAARAHDDVSTSAIGRDLTSLAQLERFALPLLEDLANLPERAPWSLWLSHLGALASRALRAPARVLGLLTALAPLGEMGPVDLADVRRVLEPRLWDAVAPAVARKYGRVFVGAIDAARGMSFDVVLVPGLAERLFPHKIGEDPLLPDRERIALSTALRTNRERAALERLALRLAAGAARKRLVVSYPRMDTDASRPRTPSFYGLEVLRAAEGTLPGFDELVARADRAVPSRLAWPAPSRAEDAIDDAEYDLALLDGITRLADDRAVGSAHYLLGANASLARALRARARRWRKRWSGADGLVDPAPQALLALATHALSARSYSPTALQHFATCPYQFFLHAIHRLESRKVPEPIEQLDARQRGNIVHDVQFKTLTALRDRGVLPITLDTLAAATLLLDATLDAVAAHHRDRLAPAIEPVWNDAIASVRADVRHWLARLASDPIWTPAHFELSFGVPLREARDVASVPGPVTLECGIKLRGSIDLVEQRRDGALRATDYKTGRAITEPETVIGGGTTLQPVLYALALEQLLPERVVVSGRLDYCTDRGRFTPVEIPLDRIARTSAGYVAAAVGSALTDGFFPAAPEKDACSRCEFLRVCGPSEYERTRQKPVDRLVPLIRLRGAR